MKAHCSYVHVGSLFQISPSRICFKCYG
jgi:hypothetical protein